MFKKIIATIGTRLITAIITLALVVLNAHYLGAKNVGTISLIILAITINQLVNNFVGGPALVYLVPRTDLWKLFVPSYLWALVSSFAGSVIMELLHLIPEGFFIHVMILSFFLALFFVNTMILMGQERIPSYNLVSLLQVIVLMIVLTGLIFIVKRRDVMAYITGLYCSYSFAFLLSFFMVLPKLKRAPLKGSMPVLKEIFRYGTVMQFGNIFQLFNYRLSYYFIETFLNRATVGVYSVGVQLSEGIWLISRSISMVQYSRISNDNDRAYAIRLTLSLVRISFIVTFLVLGFILLLPSAFFTFIFGPEFHYVKLTMVSLAAGILTLSVSITISPFFSGIGKPHHNTVSSAIGLVFTIVGGYVLIPKIGLIGAGISASISYTMATIYQVIVFARFARLKMKDLMVTKAEISMLRTEIKKVMKKEIPLP